VPRLRSYSRQLQVYTRPSNIKDDPALTLYYANIYFHPIFKNYATFLLLISRVKVVRKVADNRGTELGVIGERSLLGYL
jgi:hypothetical protein